MNVKMILIYMLLSHVLGDFYAQSDKMAAKKKESYKWVLAHSFIYAFVALAVLLFSNNINLLIVAGIMGIMHFVIDTIKFLLTKGKQYKSINVFVVDQLVHIVSILFLAYVFRHRDLEAIGFKCITQVFRELGKSADQVIKWGLTLLCIHKPANCFIQEFLSGFRITDRSDGKIIEPKVDIKAGRIIGTLERFIMVVLLSFGQFAALGLVLTAKSIARYDKINKNESFAEYYLMGTLLSLSVVVVCYALIIR